MTSEESEINLNQTKKGDVLENVVFIPQDESNIFIEDKKASDDKKDEAPWRVDAAHSLSTWGDNMWWFAGGVFMLHLQDDDLRLTAEEKLMLRRWAEQGAPEGDPTAAAPLPAPPDLELKDKDETHAITAPVEVSGSKDKFMCFSLPLNNTSMQFLEGVQINPGNESIVHHVLVYADPSGASEALADEKAEKMAALATLAESELRVPVDATMWSSGTVNSPW